MAGTVKLPVIGQVKTGWALAGGAAVIVIAGVAWHRHSQAAAAASSASSAAAGTASSAPVDPATGYPQGSPEDLAALQQQSAGYGYGSYGGGGYGGYGYAGGGMYWDPVTGMYDLTSPYSSAGSGANAGPGTFTDNAYWVQYAEQNVQGYTAAQVQGALAAYLSGLGLSTTQMSIYQASVAVAGPAPQPPSSPAHLSGGGQGGGGGGQAEVIVPDVIGMKQDQAAQVLSSVGLKPEGPAPVHGRTHIVTAQAPHHGSAARRGTVVHLTSKLV